MEKLKEAKTIKRIGLITSLVTVGGVALYYYKVILVFLLVILLIVGCCAVMPLAIPLAINNLIRDRDQVDNFEQVLAADLPENVRFLTNDANRTTLSYPVTDSSDTYFKSLYPSPNGRYLLTSEGFFDFTTGIHHTLVKCPRDSQYVNESPPYWLNDELFIRDRCAFKILEPEKLQAGKFKPNLCREDPCLETEEQAELELTLKQTDEMLVDEESNQLDYYFIHYLADGTFYIWRDLISKEDNYSLEAIRQSGLPITSIEIQVGTEGGRWIEPGTEALSPDRQFKAILDKHPRYYRVGYTLTIVRMSDNTVVAQVSVQDIHQTRFKDEWQAMAVHGWTDDSRQIIFSVGTHLPLPYSEGVHMGYNLYEHFVLFID